MILLMIIISSSYITIITINIIIIITIMIRTPCCWWAPRPARAAYGPGPRWLRHLQLSGRVVMVVVVVGIIMMMMIMVIIMMMTYRRILVGRRQWLMSVEATLALLTQERWENNLSWKNIKLYFLYQIDLVQTNENNLTQNSIWHLLTQNSWVRSQERWGNNTTFPEAEKLRFIIQRNKTTF